MLPDPALGPAYEKIIWLYVYRDFSKNKADKKAATIALRFGMTSWPQHLLVAPRNLKIMGSTGRSVKTFLAAVEKYHAGKVDWREAEKMVYRTKQDELEASRIERKGDKKRAIGALASDDILLQYAGLRVLAKKDPSIIAERAAELLGVPNDPFRYEVCAALKTSANPAAGEWLEMTVRKPFRSLNPNVLRMRAVDALSTCGDAGSVDVIAPFAISGKYFNSLTGLAVDTLAEIAKRHPDARKRVRDALKQAYPPLPGTKTGIAMRYCEDLARRVHAARGVKTPFPKVYDEAAREELMR